MLAVAVPGGPTVRLPSSPALCATSVVEAVCSKLGFGAGRARDLALKGEDGIELAPSSKVGDAAGLTLMPRPSVFEIALPVDDGSARDGSARDDGDEDEHEDDEDEDGDEETGEAGDGEAGDGEPGDGEPGDGGAGQAQPEPLRFAVTGHVTGAQLASHVAKASAIPVEQLRFVKDPARPWESIIELDPATPLWRQGHTGALRWAAVRVPPKTLNVAVTLHAGPGEAPRALSVTVRAQASTTHGDVTAALLALPQLASARLCYAGGFGSAPDSSLVLGRSRGEVGSIDVTAHIGPLALTVRQAPTGTRVPVVVHVDDRVGALKLAATIACGRKMDDAPGLFLRHNGTQLDDDAALKSCSGLTDGAYAVTCTCECGP